MIPLPDGMQHWVVPCLGIRNCQKTTKAETTASQPISNFFHSLQHVPQHLTGTILPHLAAQKHIIALQALETPSYWFNLSHRDSDPFHQVVKLSTHRQESMTLLVTKNSFALCVWDGRKRVMIARKDVAAHFSSSFGNTI